MRHVISRKTCSSSSLVHSRSLSKHAVLKTNVHWSQFQTQNLRQDACHMCVGAVLLFGTCQSCPSLRKPKEPEHILRRSDSGPNLAPHWPCKGCEMESLTKHMRRASVPRWNQLGQLGISFSVSKMHMRTYRGTPENSVTRWKLGAHMKQGCQNRCQN